MDNFLDNPDQSLTQRMLSYAPRLWYNMNFDASELWNDVSINSKGMLSINQQFENFDVQDALEHIQCPISLVLGRHDYFNSIHL